MSIEPIVSAKRGLVAPEHLITIDPKVKSISSNNEELNPNPLPTQFKRAEVLHLRVLQANVEAVCHIVQRDASEPFHIARLIEWKIVHQHPVAVSSDGQSDSPVVVEGEEQAEGPSIHTTVEHMAVSSDRYKPHPPTLAVAANVRNGSKTDIGKACALHTLQHLKWSAIRSVRGQRIQSNPLDFGCPSNKRIPLFV